jgi:UDP-glucose 4-epimerase
LNSGSQLEFIPYAQAYAPGFDDMRRRKPRTEKLNNALNFRPAKALHEIIRLTAR